jgi:DNA polymerase III sliding clamp (beta) subunit (PCNA family)
MKVTLNRKTFLAALKTASLFINPKSKLPILTYALLRADSQGGKLIGTDLETTISIPIETKGRGHEDFLIPVKAMKSFLTAKAFDTVELYKDKKGLHLTGIADFQDSMDPGDFPHIEERAGDVLGEYRIDGRQLFDGLSTVIHAISQDSNRYALNTVQLYGTTITGCDGHRLAVHPITGILEEGIIGFGFIKPEIFIPFNAASSLLKILVKIRDQGDWLLRHRKEEIGSSLYMAESTTGTELFVRLPSAEYPSWAKIITPGSARIMATVDKVQLQVALQMMDAAFDKAHKSILFKIRQNMLYLENWTPRTMTVKQELGCEANAPTEFLVNYFYLLDTLKALGGTDNIEIIIRPRPKDEAQNPVVFHIPGADATAGIMARRP